MSEAYQIDLERLKKANDDYSDRSNSMRRMDFATSIVAIKPCYAVRPCYNSGLLSLRPRMSKDESPPKTKKYFFKWCTQHRLSCRIDFATSIVAVRPCYHSGSLSLRPRTSKDESPKTKKYFLSGALSINIFDQ